MEKRFSGAIAYFVTHHRRALFAGVGLLLLLSAILLLSYFHLDSEVLNLLPGGFDSVESLKTYNREFTQARELTFAVYDPGKTVSLDEFTEHFGAMLRKEPWVARVMDRSPMEDPDGMRDVEHIALPLLFNLPPSDFETAVKLLDPANLTARLHRFHQEIEAGSPRAEMQLGFDPLGLLGQALKPLAGSLSDEQTAPLASRDGTLHLVLVITNQPGLAVPDCQKLMAQVEDFKRRVLADWQGGPAPEILVTGRTPYVAEMSRSMERDIVSTLFGRVFYDIRTGKIPTLWDVLSTFCASVILVAIVFYAGFRRVRPLFAVLQVLLLCCVLAVAAGSVIFRSVNGITIGFCSILVGLGVDFGMLLYGSYEARRNEGKGFEEAMAGSIWQLGKGVFFGALTTAAGFLCLAVSGCAGFAQLGVLIAIGILLAAAFMMTLFFAFMGPKHRPRKKDWLHVVLGKYVASVFENPIPPLAVSTVLLLLLWVLAALPMAGKLRFEANPQSLEPKGSQAGRALRIITSTMSSAGSEPILVLIDSTNPEEFHDRWAKAAAHWNDLVRQGIIRSVSSPAALALSPERVRQNVAAVSKIDLAATRQALSASLNAEGFNPAGFENAFDLLDQLSKVAGGDPAPLDWRRTLPKSSIWWFPLDKFFGTSGTVGAAFVFPTHTVATTEEKERLKEKLIVPGVPTHITGWSFTLADLVPWSHQKLIQLSVIMVLFNIILLIFLYRRLAPLLLLMISLALSMGALIATVKMCGISLNLFNVLAFPLVLGVGVDYGIYVLLAVRQPGDREAAFATILKPVLLSGLCTVAGFGSLGLAENPSLSGLGIVCAIGVAWCLFATLFFILPAYVWRRVQ